MATEVVTVAPTRKPQSLALVKYMWIEEFPVDPADFDAYVLSPNPPGGLAPYANFYAIFVAKKWILYRPALGDEVMNIYDRTRYRFSGQSWNNGGVIIAVDQTYAGTDAVLIKNLETVVNLILQSIQRHGLAEIQGLRFGSASMVVPQKLTGTITPV